MCGGGGGGLSGLFSDVTQALGAIPAALGAEATGGDVGSAVEHSLIDTAGSAVGSPNLSATWANARFTGSARSIAPRRAS